MPSKNCDFCDFFIFSKNCKKIGEIALFAIFTRIVLLFGSMSIKEHRSHVDSFHNDLSIFTCKPQKKECVKVTVTAYVDPQHFAVMTLYIYIQDRYSNRGVL